VRHGHLPEREVMTGIGPITVRCPRVRDPVGTGDQRIRFTSPPAVRHRARLRVNPRASLRLLGARKAPLLERGFQSQIGVELPGQRTSARAVAFRAQNVAPSWRCYRGEVASVGVLVQDDVIRSARGPAGRLSECRSRR
jgi:hypothetical protein